MSGMEWVASYFILGSVVLLIFDLVTGGRIRNRLQSATDETQSKILEGGSYIGRTTSGIMFAVALILFWWVVLVGAVIDARSRKAVDTKSDNEVDNG